MTISARRGTLAVVIARNDFFMAAIIRRPTHHLQLRFKDGTSMKLNILLIQLVGGVVFLVGVIGVFARVSADDGALAIAGAVVFASGVIADALKAPK